jgi:hypothetical protein
MARNMKLLQSATSSIISLVSSRASWSHERSPAVRGTLECQEQPSSRQANNFMEGPGDWSGLQPLTTAHHTSPSSPPIILYNWSFYCSSLLQTLLYCVFPRYCASIQTSIVRHIIINIVTSRAWICSKRSIVRRGGLGSFVWCFFGYLIQDDEQTRSVSMNTFLMQSKCCTDSRDLLACDCGSKPFFSSASSPYTTHILTPSSNHLRITIYHHCFQSLSLHSKPFPRWHLPQTTLSKK